jgi:hypothetical protein
MMKQVETPGAPYRDNDLSFECIVVHRHVVRLLSLSILFT